MQIKLNNKYYKDGENVIVDYVNTTLTFNFDDSDVIFLMDWFNRIRTLVKSQYVDDIYFDNTPFKGKGKFNHCFIKSINFTENVVEISYDYRTYIDPISERINKMNKIKSKLC